jgi:hypothetical protein
LCGCAPVLSCLSSVGPTCPRVSPNILLAKTTSNHFPCIVQIGKKIPKANIFRFENYWIQHLGFFEVVQQAWAINVRATNRSSVIALKFKNIRRALKGWSKNISILNSSIQNYNEVLQVIEKLEEMRLLVP